MLGQAFDPPGRLVLERMEGLVHLNPEPRQKPDQHLEREIGPGGGKRVPGLAPFEQHGGAAVIVREELHRTVTVPGDKSVRFVLGLAVRIDQLEDGWRSVRELHARRMARGSRDVGLSLPQLPKVDALAH